MGVGAVPIRQFFRKLINLIIFILLSHAKSSATPFFIDKSSPNILVGAKITSVISHFFFLVKLFLISQEWTWISH